MRVRFALLAGLTAGALVAPLAVAAPAPQITDPKGDALGAQASLDIISVTYQATKASKAKNAPFKEFIVTMELDGAPNLAPGIAYSVRADQTPCDGLIMYAYWGVIEAGPTVGGFFLSCGPTDPTTGTSGAYLNPTLKIDGKKLSFVVPAGAVPKEVKSAVLGGLSANTAVAEPLAGISTDVILGDLGGPEGSGTFDFAKSEKSWKFGS